MSTAVSTGAMRAGVAFFGAESLNRVSFLRNDLEFVRSSLEHASTVFIPFVHGEAILSRGNELGICELKLQDEWFSLRPIVDRLLPLLNTEAARVQESGANLTFLGLKEGGDFSYKSQYRGSPYYAIDFRPSSTTLIQSKDLGPLLQAPQANRTSILEMTNAQASLYSHARMYLDWLAKYNYCPGCGSVMYPVDAGTKMQCGNKDKNVHCNVRDARVNNVCFPRTDPVVIVAIATRDYSKICLARSKRRVHDTVLYSTIAGFMEPAETVENACSREIWEETGIKCHDVNLVSTQPWPYPVNLMVGCVGLVDANGTDDKIDLTHDEELMDAQWFSTQDVAEALDKYNGTAVVQFRDDITFPGKTAIAHQLIKFVCDKYKRSLASL